MSPKKKHPKAEKPDRLVAGMLAASILLSSVLFAYCVVVFMRRERAIEASAANAMTIINRLKPKDMADVENIKELMREAVEYYRAYMDYYKENSSSNLVALVYGLISTALVGVLGIFVQRQKDRIDKLNEEFEKRSAQSEKFSNESGHRLKEFDLLYKSTELDIEKRMIALKGFDSVIEEKQKALEGLTSSITIQQETLEEFNDFIQEKQKALEEFNDSIQEKQKALEEFNNSLTVQMHRLSAVKAFDGIMQQTNQIMIHSTVLYGTISSDSSADEDTINSFTVVLRECFCNLLNSMESNINEWNAQMKGLFVNNIIQTRRNLNLLRPYAEDPNCAYQQSTSTELLGYCSDCLS